MPTKKNLWILLLTAALTACGGGGGSPNVPSGNSTTTPTGGGSGSGGSVVSSGTLALELQDPSGAATTTIALLGTTAKATLVDAAKAPIANRLVTFTTDAALATMTPTSGQVLTNSSGVASIQLAPAALTATGAGTLSATAVVGSTTLTQSLDYQLSPANLKLEALNVGRGALAAYGNRAVTVQVTANGVPLSTPVQVTFFASCGAANLIPATVSTNSNGIASTTYAATLPDCFGTNVTISASAAGANTLTGQIAVAPAQVANIQFVSSAPRLIYLTGSTGATQSLVTFKVIDSNGNAVQNQSLQFSLVNSGPGVSLNVSGNTAPVPATTDGSGQASVAVFSGTVPTSVQVQAIIPSDLTVPPTLSNVLTVASGRAVQKATSIALGQFAIEGFSIDGITTTVTVSLADRQGNPVPDGTQINLTSESGVLVPPTCVTSGGTSSCQVNIRSQGARPADGRVSILAYLPGEEDFVDANANNVYDAGESFTDLGDAYRDDNEDGLYVNVDDFTVPRASPAVACAAPISGAGAPDNVAGGDHGRADRCDGVWGTADVRRQIVVVFATSTSIVTPVGSTAGTKIRLSNALVRVSDLNGNSMPIGSKIALSSTDSGCTLSSPVSAVPNVAFSKTQQMNGSAGTLVPIVATGCVAGNNVTVTVTAPSTLATSVPFTFE